MRKSSEGPVRNLLIPTNPSGLGFFLRFFTRHPKSHLTHYMPPTKPPTLSEAFVYVTCHGSGRSLHLAGLHFRERLRDDRLSLYLDLLSEVSP